MTEMQILGCFLLPPASVVLAAVLALVGSAWLADQEGEIDDAHLADRQTTALQSLATWSEWLISIQVALIGFLLVDLNFGRDIIDSSSGPFWGVILSLLVSIAAAAVLIGAIPDAISKCPIRRESGPLSVRTTATTRTQEAEISDKRLVGDLYAHPTILRIPLRATATIQGAAFLTGIFWLLFGMALSG
jgi:hypothetical protein